MVYIIAMADQMSQYGARSGWETNPAMMIEYMCGCLWVFDYPFPSTLKMGQCKDHPGHKIYESVFLPPVTKVECDGP